MSRVASSRPIFSCPPSCRDLSPRLARSVILGRVEREDVEAFTGQVEGAVCPACSCLCDDITLAVMNGRVTESVNACERGKEQLANLGDVRGEFRLDGAVVSATEILARLSDARAPLVVLGPDVSLEAAREAARFASQRSLPIVSTEQLADDTDRLGLDAPEITATLGEIRSSADVVIFWECDPETTHPRHLERYSRDPALRTGSPRQVIVVDSVERLATNATAAQVDEVIEITSDRTNVDLIVDARLGPSSGESERLLAAIRSARHVQVFVGDGAFADAAVRDSLFAWAATMRDERLMTVSALGKTGNLRGVREVMSWVEAPDTPGLGLEFADLVYTIGAADLDVPPNASHLELVSSGLDPRTNATVVRGDGVFLTLCGRDFAGCEDPAARALRELRSVEAAR